jgi:tRNA (guanine37-N1)-methyltransferase
VTPGADEIPAEVATEEGGAEAAGATDGATPAQRVDVLTLFPDMVNGTAGHSILGRARAAGRLDLRVHDLRDWTTTRYRQADDTPFGGGAGMVLLPGPIFAAVEELTGDAPGVPVIFLGPDGETFTQAVARELATLPRYVLLCGHYEGIDERAREAVVTRTISLGDYVLTGGELAALVVIDAVTRLLPGVLGNAESAHEESFSGEPGAQLLEYPHYTRPANFRDMAVPEVLLSGHHANIAKWRRQQALARTRARRPDLWEKLLPLSKADQKLLDAYDREAGERRAAAGAETSANPTPGVEPVSTPASDDGLRPPGEAPKNDTN